MISKGGGAIANADAESAEVVTFETDAKVGAGASIRAGGELAADTDAQVNALEDAESFAAGSIRLHPEASEAALLAHVGEALGLDAVTAAWGLSEVVDETMANAARVHAVAVGAPVAEEGHAVLDRDLVAFEGVSLGRCRLLRVWADAEDREHCEGDYDDHFIQRAEALHVRLLGVGVE